MLQQSLCSIFNHVQHPFETLFTAVIRVRHLAFSVMPRIIEKQPRIFFAAARRQVPQYCKICTVHRQHIVEVFHILSYHLPSAQPTHIKAALRSSLLGTKIRRMADVIVMRPCRIDQYGIRQSRILDIMAEYRLGCGGSADVAHAHEEHFNFCFHYIRCEDYERLE